MERFTCRTCLSITDTDTSFQIFEQCTSGKTIKDVLSQYIPTMEKTLSGKDRICTSCLKTLKSFLEFIDKCMKIEENLTNEQITIGGIEHKNKETEEEAHVVENIEIVLEEELKPLFNEQSISTSISAATSTVDHDHAYMKPQITATDKVSIIKSESIEDDEDDASQKVLSTNHSCEQDDSFDGMGNIQFIPVAAVTDEMLGGDFSNISESHNSISPNITVLATGDELIDPNILQIKEESMDSLMESCDGIAYYQPLSVESNIYICELCGNGFLNQSLLQQHFLEHGELRIMCDKCPKIFKNHSALRAHYKLKHLDSERFKCDICGHIFARADYLRNHLKRHEDEKQDNIKCRVPGKFLRFKNTEDPLPCKICGKYYNGIQKLKVHLQTHLVVKRFACEYCDLTYKRWPSLRRHERTHLEADTFFYRCNVCWKRFTQKEELDMHMNQHGNPRYRCQVCDEQFHRKYLFDNHYLLSHATPEDIENSKKEVIYDTLLELSNQNVIVTE